VNANENASTATSKAVLPSLIAVLAIVLLSLAPNVGPQVVSENQAVEAIHGRIREIVPATTGEAFRPPFANVEVLEGARRGQVLQAYLEGPGGSQIVANYQPGDEVVVTITKDESGAPYLAVSDRWRAPLLGGFVLLFAVAVVLVGGFRGLRALISLGLTIAIILKFLIPMVLNGYAPVPLAVITAIGVTLVTILLTEGWSRTSAAAILGTAAALALTGLLSAAATALASFTYSAGSDLAFLQTANGQGLDLRGLLLAAFILGAVGVLDDVTVTQAALVATLVDEGATGRRLIASAMDVGRSHIAATVNTLFLAYVGAGLPIIVTILVSNQPSALVLNSEEVATEVIRTLVGSLGIVAAVPFTTVVAGALIDRGSRSEGARMSRDRRIIGVAGAGALIVVALAATAVMPLGQGRSALPVERFGPSSVPGGPSDEAPSGDPGASDGATGSGEPGPAILSKGDTYQLAANGSSIDVTIDDVKAKAASGRTSVSVMVTLRNEGPSDYDTDPTAWGLVTSGGENITMQPTTSGGLVAKTLGVGATEAGELHAEVKASAADTFVTFTDADGVVAFAVAADGT
jgi:uncharacterized membrane protein